MAAVFHVLEALAVCGSADSKTGWDWNTVKSTDSIKRATPTVCLWTDEQFYIFCYRIL